MIDLSMTDQSKLRRCLWLYRTEILSKGTDTICCNIFGKNYRKRCDGNRKCRVEDGRHK